MFTLAAGETLAGVAGSASAITYTLTGDDRTISPLSDAYGTLAQGQLAAASATIYGPVVSGHRALCQTLFLANTSAGAVTCAFFINGTTGVRLIASFQIEANGFAILTSDGWKTYDATGKQLFVGSTGAQGIQGIQGEKGWSPVLAVVTDGARRVFQITSWVGGAGTPPSSTNQFIGPVGIVGTAAAAVDIRGPAGADGVSPVAFTTVTGNTGTATADTASDSLAIIGTGHLTAVGSDNPEVITISGAAATFTAAGTFTATEKIEHNSMDGRTNAGATPRVFRPGDFMVGNTFDPTGAANSTSAFSAMMTALRAHNDRCMIQLSPGVFRVDHDIIKDFGSNNTSVPIRGPGRGTCVLLPNSAPTGTQSMITPNRNTTGGDAVSVSGFTIYNTSGAVYTVGNGILTNGADGIDISEVAFIDLFNDVHVSGEPHTMTTTVGTALSGVSPVFTAADVGQVVSGPGIPAGTTLTAQAGATGTLSGAGATVATTAVRFLNNSIKVSVQKMVSFNTNGNGNGCGVVVNNGQAGDTYLGPDIVMSDGGGTTRRRACIELIETGHYEITQCNLTGSQRGILIDPGASQSVAFGFHTNVLCDSNTVNGMLLDTLTTTSTIKNCKSVNSWYSGTVVVNGSAAGAGVKTQATGAGVMNGFTFTTDRFLNNRTHGFEHAAALATDFRWSDCDMKGNNSANAAGTAVPAAGNSGLSVAANIGNWSINGGKYGGTDTVPTAGQQEWGILVAAGTGNNIKISPDDLSGNRLGPLSFGATGVSNFINGCPGLPANYVRGATSASITTVTTLGNILIPKNSQRVSSSYRLTARGKAAGATTVPVFSVRIGGTNDVVGTAATNPTIVIASDATLTSGGWTSVEFIVTVTVVGNGANSTLQGAGSGSSSTAATTARAFGSGIAAIGAGAGQLATVNLTTDQYLTLAYVGATAGMVFYTTNIDVLNY